MPSTGDRTLPETATAWFAAEVSSISAARDYTAEHFSKWGMEGQSGIASLVVSELTSNALRHAQSGFELELTHSDGTVRIVVRDESSAAPILRDPNNDSDAGRGLRIVAELATEWGYEVGNAGKQVWAFVSDVVLRQPPDKPGARAPAARGNTHGLLLKTKDPPFLAHG